MSGRAKALVKKWKQLLSDGQDTQSSQVYESAGQRSYRGLRTEGHSLAMRGLEEEDYTGGATLPRPTIHIESGGSNSSAMDVTSTATSTPHSHKRHHKDKEKKKKKKASSEHHDDGSFSRALEVPLKVHSSRHDHRKKEREERAVGGGSPRKTEQPDVVVLGVTPGQRPGPTRKLMKEGSPAPTTAPTQREVTAVGVKRKGM